MEAWNVCPGARRLVPGPVSEVPAFEIPMLEDDGRKGHLSGKWLMTPQWGHGQHCGRINTVPVHYYFSQL